MKKNLTGTEDNYYLKTSRFAELHLCFLRANIRHEIGETNILNNIFILVV
jgi:hypothetical protein